MLLSFNQVFKNSTHSHILRRYCWLLFKFICDYSFLNMPPPSMNYHNSLLIGFSISSPVFLKSSFHLGNAAITIVLVNELNMFLPQPFKVYHPINKIQSLCWGLEVPVLLTFDELHLRPLLLPGWSLVMCHAFGCSSFSFQSLYPHSSPYVKR